MSHCLRTSFSIALGLAGLLLSGCSNDNSPTMPVPQPVVQNVPAQFRLTGSARGAAPDGRTADCSLDLIFEIRGETSRTRVRVEYQGVHGGEAVRKVLRKNGSGFSFVADVYGEVEIQLDTLTGALNIRVPINETADGRFWRNLSLFPGMIDAAGHGDGTWTCAPLDIDQGGYIDKSLTVHGAWEIAPM